MSTFTNISNGVLYVQGFLRKGDGTLGVGAQVYIEQGESFSGSNYYKRFTYAGMVANGVDETVARSEAILETTVDDGLAFNESVAGPNNPRVYLNDIAPASERLYDFQTDLGGPAEFCSIESDEDVHVYLNTNANARYTLAAGGSITFNAGELLLNNITIANAVSGASNATVQVIVANTV